MPFGGKFPTLGTNPHSWAFPTTDLIGFPICIDAGPKGTPMQERIDAKLAEQFKEWGAIQAVERLNLDGLLALWHPPSSN